MRGGARLRVTGVLVAVSLLAPSGMQGICSAAERFVAPVDGPIIRHFEQPQSPFGRGHRGIDFGVPEGTEVVASNDGAVTFAGPVADDGLFVTIAHHGVLETTYSFLFEVKVSAGDEVRRGDVIALSGVGHPGEDEPSLHFGARIGDHYIDPEILLLKGLEDISDLIALAPLEETSYQEEAGLGGGSGYLDPIEAGASEGRGFFVRLGERIGSWGKALGRLASGVGRWLWDRGTGVARLGAGVADRVGGWLEAAWGGIRSAASAVAGSVAAAAAKTGAFVAALWDWGAGALRTVGGWLADAMRGLWRVSKTAFRWVRDSVAAVLRGIGWAAGTTVRWVADALGATARAAVWLAGGAAKLAGAISRLVKKVAEQTFTYQFFPAAFEQLECQRNGHPPPVLPTREELDGGSVAPPPPNENIVVAVAGLGSQTSLGPDGTMTTNAAMYQMDFDTLGYSDDDVYFFSYAGIGEGGRGPYRLHEPYNKGNTEQSIRDSAKLLAAQIGEIRRRHPDRQIDLVAHSQGGLVAQYYLAHLYDLDNPEGKSIDHYITIGTPHHGADAAQLHRLLAISPRGQVGLEGLDVVAVHWGFTSPSSASVRQMAEGSDFLTQLDEAWDPSKVDATTIAATFDAVVTPQHTRLRGARHYTADLPSKLSSTFAHSAVVNADSTREIVYNALAGAPSACTPIRDVVADYSVGRTLSLIEDALILVYAAGLHSVGIGGAPW